MSDNDTTQQTSGSAGRQAEDLATRFLEKKKFRILARNYRCRGGEIDLVARDGAEVIFIEVKASRTHAAAAERLEPRQMARICAAASEYLAGEPLGQLTPARFDVALVDGQGRVEILENAFAA